VAANTGNRKPKGFNRAKQARAVAVIVEEPTLTAAEERCKREAICARATFWKWLATAEFRSQVEAAQQAVLGNVLAEIREMAKRDALENYRRLLECGARGGSSQQVQALKALMLLAGISEFSTSSSIKIGVSATATAQSLEEADRAFVERANAARNAARRSRELRGQNDG
jgi:hypothetical protein